MTIPRAVVVIMAFGLQACAAAAPIPERLVPRAAGLVADSPTACRVTGAWRADGEAVSPPSVTRCVLPWYPSERRRLGEEGTVVARVDIDSLGRPVRETIRWVRTTASDFESAVARSLPFVRFDMTRREVAAPVRVELTYTFQLVR